MYGELCDALAVNVLQDGSCDIQQQDNYFHGVQYVCGKTGKLKSAFLDFRVKQIRGAEGQVDCLARALFSLLKYDKHTADIENEGYIDTFHQVALENAA